MRPGDIVTGEKPDEVNCPLPLCNNVVPNDQPETFLE